jgi:ABC-type Fe3+ transport system substrate-binding protein
MMERSLHWHKFGFVLIVLSNFILTVPVNGRAQTTKIGTSVEEITKLAIQEGRVRMASGLEPAVEPLILQTFREKYPQIKVEHSELTPPDRERILNEALSGVVDFDVVDVSTNLHENYLKAKVLAGPFDFKKLFVNVPENHFSPNGHFVGVGFSANVIAYNSALVPANRVPKDWQNCLDSYWRGKFVVVSRPKSFVGLSFGWGENKVLEYAAQLKNNQPVWKNSQAESFAQMGAGEYQMICGAYYFTYHSLIRNDPKAKIAVTFPSEVPVILSETLAIMKGARNPNAGLLLAAWLASPEGQKGYDKIGRGSPFIKGGEATKLLEKSGSKIIYAGWELPEREPEITKRIIAAWGFRNK